MSLRTPRMTLQNLRLDWSWTLCGNPRRPARTPQFRSRTTLSFSLSRAFLPLEYHSVTGLAAVDAPICEPIPIRSCSEAESWLPATAITTLCLTFAPRSSVRRAVAYATVARRRHEAHIRLRPTTRYPQYRELPRLAGTSHLAGSSHDGAFRPRLVAVQPACPAVGDLRAPGAGRLDDHRLDRQPLPARGDAASPPRCDRQAAAGHSGAAGHRGHPGRAAALHRRVGGRPGGLRFRPGHRLLPRLGAGDPRPEFASPIRQQVVCGDRCAGVQRRLPARARGQHRRSGLRRAGRLPLRAVSWVCRGPNCAGRRLGRRPDGREYRARGPRRRLAGAGRAGITLATDVSGYELEVSSPQGASGRVVSVHDREVHLRRVRHGERHPSAAADAAGGGPAWPWPVPAAGRYPRDA